MPCITLPIRPSFKFLPLSLLCLAGGLAQATPVINELMYHPTSSIGNPEDQGKEWIEIHNPGLTAADVSGWKLSKGVAFTFPAATSIPAGGYLVIAADVAKFQAQHPAFSGTLLGPWVGTLANGGEEVQLDTAAGSQVDDVTYADEGLWAVRIRSAVSFGHQGWEWEALHDGGGYSLAKMVATKPSLEGQNWKASAIVGGSPGAANWTVLPPEAGTYALDVRHSPEIPRSTDAIQVKATFQTGGITNRVLRWRPAGGSAFAVLGFVQDGPSSGTTWDGIATIPPQADGTIIEYYVDPETNNPATVNDTVPRKARTSGIGVLPETFANVCNHLIQVDDSFDPARNLATPGNHPLLRVVLTPADATELNTIQTTSGQEQSDAAFNTAFISHDGQGTKVVQNASVRNRGFSSALGPPSNFHVTFRSDDTWNGRGGIQLNCQFGYGQVLGNVLFAVAGIAPQDAVAVQFRVNGQDLSESGGRMYGRYSMMEGRGPDWAKKHYPLDPDGNFYRLDDHEPGALDVPPGNLESGEFRYEGTNPASYSDTFYKETNKDANDYSDLINLTRILGAPASGGTVEQPAITDTNYPAAAAAVLDLDHFYKYIATDALVGNQEGGLQSGRADDTSIYRGVVDPRFRFVPHDLDDVFDIGSGVGNPITRSIFSYDEQVQQGNTGVVGLRRLFNHPALLPKYYAALLNGLDTWFNHATIDPIIDRLFTGWVPGTDGSAASPNRGIAEIKGYIDARRANILSQIQQNYSLTVTGSTADSVEGYKVTTTGAATLSGTFNVARTYSITVNGVAAQWFYRTVGADASGTWKMLLAAGGGGLLKPGLNKLVVRFWDGINGTGNVVQEFQSNLLWDGAAPGSLAMLAPASYIPGIPMLVRVDLRTGSGNLDRSAWNSTVNLTGSNGVTISPTSMTLANGIGSALLTVGGGGVTNVPVFVYGTGGNGTNGSGVPGSQWKYKSDFTTASLNSFITTVGTTWRNGNFNDASWTTGRTQAGYGNNDENTLVPDLDYDPATAGSQNVPCYLFRNTFTIADVGAVTALTGQIKYDDGYAIYVNGQEINQRRNIAANSPLTAYASGNDGDNAVAAVTIPLNVLQTGVNTIAVEIRQATAASSDVTFDLRLTAAISSGAADPGNFSLTATSGTFSTSRAMISLGTPAATTVSGTLPVGVTNWSGLVSVTGDVTIPTGATLEIAPGTHILMTGTTGAGDTAGTDLICTGGIINALGTLAQPISITAHDANARWGEINVGGSTTTWNYCLISRGCHSPGGGHTGTGPCFRLANGAVWTFEDGVIADLPGKTLTNTGNTTMVMRRSQFARCVMGPETDGSGITIEDCNFSDMLPAYRESGAADDEDNIYIHDSGGRPVILRRSVFHNCADDAIDCLAGSLTIEDCIVRNAFDKGISLLNNNVTVRRTQIVDCDICVSTKCQIAQENVPYLNTFENCTIVAENHPTNTSDGTFHSVGVHTRNKYGTTTMNITVDLRNCIISAEEPVANDYGGGTFPLNVQNYTCFFDQGGTIPANPLPTSGTGNLAANPQFVGTAAKNFNLAVGSPCIDTGDPSVAYNDPDGTRNDMGALPTSISGGGGSGTTVPTTISGPGETRWTLAGSPYRLTGNTTVATGAVLRIDPGVNIQSPQNVRLTVNGRIVAQGTAANRIVFSHQPGTNLATDVDPIKLGTQTGAPKWGGVRVYDSMGQENIFRYCDFINAQGTSPSGSENYGSVGFVRSWGWVDNCSFAGTHLRMCYARNSKLTVTYTTFPDMFIFDPLVGRIEEPTTDFIAAADNSMEPMKVEYPTSDAEVTGANAPNFPNGLPLNGHWRVYFNQFNGNRGHQDVFDCDSGRWSPRDSVTNNQSNGQFVIDCRYNHFRGLSGDEHMDLGGDAYIASNIFENARKDYWTNDTGYSNAISSGDKGTGTTIMVVRNICYDLDHVINCKANTATIFEHNTVSSIHPDFVFQGSTVTQNVVCAPINFFVPGDGANPTVGDGAYVGFNIISNVPHMFSGPDANAAGNGITTKIEFFNNLLDQIADPAIGPNHPGGFFSGTYGPNQAGAPGFVDTIGENYALRTDSLARGTAPGGISYGSSIPEWAYVLGGPGGTVAETSASFTVGGPGIVAYKWRLNGGAWSAPIQIGDGGSLPRSGPTVRQATLALTSLAPGAQVLEVLGQDMAGNWQGSDPARNYDGASQAAPTSRQWTIDTAQPILALSEVYGDPVQQVELRNLGAAPLSLAGWSLSDSSLTPGEQVLSGTLAPGAVVAISLASFRLDNDGDSLFLFDAAHVLKDSVVFGQLPAGYSLSRTGQPPVWNLSTPTLGSAANQPARMSDSTQIIINEWLASGDVRYKEDWVELANLAAFPASLSGMALTDARFGTRVPFPPLSFIAGNGFVKLLADGDSAAGPNHTSFKIDGVTEELLLYAASGNLQDYVRVFQQIEDVSQGRIGSGGLGGMEYFALATGGAENATTGPAYGNAVAILQGLRITEIMYNAPGGNSFDWLELRNIGVAGIDLTGMKFAEGIDFTFGNMVLAPGQNLILAADPAAFQMRYTTSIIPLQYGGRLNNDGEILAIRLAAPYDANVMCFDFKDTWYPTANTGKSLIIVSPSIPVGDLGDKASWTVGPEFAGTPDGFVITNPSDYIAWLGYHETADGDDEDFDGFDSLAEYGLKLLPGSPDQTNGASAAPSVTTDVDGKMVFSFLLPVNALAAGGHGRADVVYFIESSETLEEDGWSELATKEASLPWAGSGTVTVGAAAGGYVPVTVRDFVPTSAQSRRYIRLRFGLAQ